MPLPFAPTAHLIRLFLGGSILRRHCAPYHFGPQERTQPGRSICSDRRCRYVLLREHHALHIRRNLRDMGEAGPVQLLDA